MKNNIIAIQTNPLENLEFSARYVDSTFSVALECQNRGYSIYQYTPNDLYILNGHLLVDALPVELSWDENNHFTQGNIETINLAEVDAILMRNDPPVDYHYYEAAQKLCLIREQTLIVNDPMGVIALPEKTIPQFIAASHPHLVPETLITANVYAFRDFIIEKGGAIVKRNDDKGGQGIIKLLPNDQNLDWWLNQQTEEGKRCAVIQEFLEDVTLGDKRIIWFNGEIIGQLLRMPSNGHYLANLHAGGTATGCDINNRDLEICEAISPLLHRNGILWAGIDVIGGKLIEVNVTSPGALNEASQAMGQQLEKRLADRLEETLADFYKPKTSVAKTQRNQPIMSI
ncbi:MAG: hypothetical protein ACOYK8_08175 [Alphaproteobacteria bacterium]